MRSVEQVEVERPTTIGSLERGSDEVDRDRVVGAIDQREHTIACRARTVCDGSASDRSSRRDAAVHTERQHGVVRPVLAPDAAGEPFVASARERRRSTWSESSLRMSDGSHHRDGQRIPVEHRDDGHDPILGGARRREQDEDLRPPIGVDVDRAGRRWIAPTPDRGTGPRRRRVRRRPCPRRRSSDPSKASGQPSSP